MSSISTTLIDLLHSPSADPELISTANPTLLSSSSPPPEEFIASYRDIVATIKGYLAAAEEGSLHVSEKVKAFWKTKLESHEELLRVLEPIGNEELKKQYLERVNQVWQVGLKEVLEKVNKELVGPYALGSSHSQSHPTSFFLSFTPLLTCTPPPPSFIILNPAGPSEIDTETLIRPHPPLYASFDGSLAYLRTRFR